MLVSFIAVMEGTDLSIFDEVGDKDMRNQDDEETLDQLEWELASQSGRLTGTVNKLLGIDPEGVSGCNQTPPPTPFDMKYYFMGNFWINFLSHIFPKYLHIYHIFLQFRTCIFSTYDCLKAGFIHIMETSGKFNFFQCDRIVREFCDVSGKTEILQKCQGNVREFYIPA